MDLLPVEDRPAPQKTAHPASLPDFAGVAAVMLCDDFVAPDDAGICRLTADPLLYLDS